MLIQIEITVVGIDTDERLLHPENALMPYNCMIMMMIIFSDDINNE